MFRLQVDLALINQEGIAQIPVLLYEYFIRLVLKLYS
jgi:hypothetical protein